MKSCQIFFLSSLMMVVTGGLVLLSADQKSPGVMPIGKPVQIKAPLGLPPVPAPADNPPTAETITLGRRLYYDPVLSADNTVSCADLPRSPVWLCRSQTGFRRCRQEDRQSQFADGAKFWVFPRAVLGWPRSQLGKAS